MKILEAREVSKSFTNHLALDHVNLEVEKGRIHGLLGPNGAGKTTLIRIINHITAPDSGEVLFDGKPLIASDVKNIGYLPEERGLYKKMKVGEQAIFFARLKGLSEKEAIKSLNMWFAKLGIASWWNRKVEELSKGMAQKVQFIITVLHNPKLLIFDEPFSGFDPINANLLKNEILALRDQGATVVFSTHNMASVEEVCDDITLINRSKVILTGEVSELKRQFSDNSFTLTFRGDMAKLVEAIRPFATTVNPPVMNPSEMTTITVSLREAGMFKSLVAKANETTDLYGFSQYLPTMNDIFIRAVGEDSSTIDNQSTIS